MTLRIKHQIFLIILINAIFLTLAGTIGYMGIHSINTAKDRLVANSEMNKRLLLALNARDNIRALVYRAMMVDQSNPQEKQELTNEFNEEIAVLTNNIHQLKASDTSSLSFDSVLVAVVTHASSYQKIAQQVFEKQIAGDVEAFILISSFVESYNALIYPMQDLGKSIDQLYAELSASSNRKARNADWGIISVCLISMITAISVSISLANSLVRRIRNTKYVLTEVSMGKIPEKVEDSSKDEIGEMLASLNKYVESIGTTSHFASEIGHGNFDVSFEPLSNQDQLGHALIGMRNNLKQAAEEDKRRNWAANGLAQINDLLRDHADNLSKLADEVLAYTVRYLNYNQGCFYIVEEDDQGVFLKLEATYAWGKKKYINHRVEPGDGLLGQAWQEGGPIYMRQVPHGYVKITSGLGEATPRSILILPLNSQGEVYGLIEMAAIQDIPLANREFLQKIAEAIAANLATLRTASRTTALLDQAQQQATQLKLTDEERQQSIEELQSIQEETTRKENEYIRKITVMTETITHQQKELERLEEKIKEKVDVHIVEKLLAKKSAQIRQTNE